VEDSDGDADMEAAVKEQVVHTLKSTKKKKSSKKGPEPAASNNKSSPTQSS
jgi:hypothetical protein